MNTSFRLFPGLSRACRGAQGFTLIELLTVIAIIGILAAILIPTVGRVRGLAKAAQCVSNMRQIGTATQLFLNDNKQTMFPHTYGGHLSWTYMAPYLPKKPNGAKYPLYCPEILVNWPDHQYRTGYGFNGNFAVGNFFRRITDAYPTSRVVVCWDDPQTSSWDGGFPADGGRGSYVKMAFWHGNQTHLLLMDGHIAKVAQGADGMASGGNGSSKDYPEYRWGPFNNFPKVAPFLPPQL